MPNLLFLTQRIPYPPIKGEKIRPLQILRHFAQNYAIHLGCLIDDPADFEHVETVRAMCADAYFAGLNRNLAMLGCQKGWLTGEPLSFTFFHDRRLAAWVDKVLTQIKPDLVFVCSSNMAQYVIAHPHRPKCRIIDFADADSEKWREYAEKGSGIMKFVHAREARLVLAQDRASALWADASTFVSEPEAAIFRRLAPESANQIHAVASGVDSVYFSPEHIFESLFDPAIPAFVFTGTMDYPPNIDAACWFARDVLPLIRAQLGHAQFYVVGTNPSQEVQRLAQLDGVHVTGRVPDVRPYVAHAVASVAPLRIARGIQNKVLEAMAMGKPVITTPQALEGIDEAQAGRDLLLANSATEIADIACKLATKKLDGAPYGIAARTCVVDHYSWAARLAKFDTLIDANGK